jgi:hypothetical protein
VAVGRRVLPALLTVAAAAADTHGAHHLAFDALLAAVPFAAVAGLVCFGAYLEDRADAVLGLQALLWGLATGLLVLSCAARSNHGAGELPTLGWSALLGCLGVFGIKACLGVGPWLWRLALRPAKP